MEEWAHGNLVLREVGMKIMDSMGSVDMREQLSEGSNKKYLYFEYKNNEDDIDDVYSGFMENGIGIRWKFRN